MDDATPEERFDFQNADHGRAAGESVLWRIRRPVVPAAKKSLRVAGKATSGLRRLPDFLIIGAKRGGSTSLYRNLTAGEGFVPLFPRVEKLKGTYYFDARYDHGERWYRSHFPVRRRGSLAGEASPYYLAHPHAAARAAEVVPDAKVIVLLRDPVARAHSHYTERVAQGIEPLTSFQEALLSEDGRLRGELDHMLADPEYRSWNHLNFGYVDQSRYFAGLSRWYEHYPPARILVLASEDFYADSEAVVNRCRAFLGLEPEAAKDLTHHNRLAPEPVGADTASFIWDRVGDDVARLRRELGIDFGWSRPDRYQLGVGS